MYFFVSSRVASVAPSISAIGSTKIIPKAAIKTPNKIDNAKPVDATSLACFSSFASSILARKLPEPWPHIKPTACIIAITEKTIPTAAVAWVDIFPTKNVSAEL